MKIFAWFFIVYNVILTVLAVIIVLNIITVPPDIKANTGIWSIIYYVLLAGAWIKFWQDLKAGKDIFKYGLILGGIELAIGIFIANLFFIDTALAIIFLILVWRKKHVGLF